MAVAGAAAAVVAAGAAVPAQNNGRKTEMGPSPESAPTEIIHSSFISSAGQGACGDSGHFPPSLGVGRLGRDSGVKQKEMKKKIAAIFY